MKIPKKIKLHRKSKILELHFEGEKFELSAEYLRVYSPSAEVKGHGPGQEKLQHGKCHVGINGIEPQGHYAIKIIFDDGHDSGIFTWPFLYELGVKKEQMWADYLERLNKAGRGRDPDVSVVKFHL